MPNRILRDWTDSVEVDSLGWEAEVLFVRLIMKADDHGRFSANPRLLRSLCFPLRASVRETDITRWLAECEKAGMIRLYVSESKPFLVICKFGQQIRSKSKYPGPPSSADICEQMLANACLGGGGGEVKGGGGGGADAHPPAGEIPSVETVKAHGVTAGVPPDYCERFHAKTSERHEWLTHGSRLIDWKRRLVRYWHEDRPTWGRQRKSVANSHHPEAKPW